MLIGGLILHGLAQVSRCLVASKTRCSEPSVSDSSSDRPTRISSWPGIFYTDVRQRQISRRLVQLLRSVVAERALLSSCSTNRHRYVIRCCMSSSRSCSIAVRYRRNISLRSASTKLSENERLSAFNLFVLGAAAQCALGDL